MQQLIPAEFHGTQLNIIDHAGRKWLTAEEIGTCLGYDSSNARKGVVKLYERHGDEFVEEDSRVVNLTSRDGKPRPTRIFSETGCIRLGFFASTPRAKEFRTWASKALAGQSLATRQAELPLALENGHLKDQIRARDEIIQAKDGVIMTLQDRLIGAQGKQIRLLSQVSAMQKRQHDREIIQMIERMEAEGRPREEISAMTGKGNNYIRQRIYLARLAGRLPKGESHA